MQEIFFFIFFFGGSEISNKYFTTLTYECLKVQHTLKIKAPGTTFFTFLDERIKNYLVF